MTREQFEVLLHGAVIFQKTIHCPICGGKVYDADSLAYFCEDDPEIDDGSISWQLKGAVDRMTDRIARCGGCWFTAHEAFFTPGAELPKVFRDEEGYYVVGGEEVSIGPIKCTMRWSIDREYALILRIVNAESIEELPEALSSDSETVRRVAASRAAQLKEEVDTTVR